MWINLRLQDFIRFFGAALACLCLVGSMASAQSLTPDGLLRIQLSPYYTADLIAQTDSFRVYAPYRYAALSSYEGTLPCHRYLGDGTARSFPFNSSLVVVADETPDFRFTRKYIWDRVRPEILPIVSEICPRSESVKVHLFLKRHTITETGLVFDPEAQPLPIVEFKPPRDPSKLDDYFSAFAHKFMQQSIVSASFTTQDDPVCAWPKRDCNWETMHYAARGAASPNYHRPISLNSQWRFVEEAHPDAWRDPRLPKLTVEERVARFDASFEGYLAAAQIADRYSSFNDQVAVVAERHRRSMLAAAREAQRGPDIITQALSDSGDYIEEHGWGQFFLMGVINMGWDGRRCTADDIYSCVEDAPIIVMDW